MREPEFDVVRRAQLGDSDAFEDLVRSYIADVNRLALHIVRDAETAEDVTQDTFLKAFRSLRLFEGRAKFSTWLFSITRNTAIEAIRSSARRRRLLEHGPRDRLSPDPSLRVALRDAIDKLPDVLREAFVVVEVLGFTYPEASMILSIPVGTLKSRMHRARRLLIAELDDEERADEM